MKIQRWFLATMRRCRKEKGARETWHQASHDVAEHPLLPSPSPYFEAAPSPGSPSLVHRKSPCEKAVAPAAASTTWSLTCATCVPPRIVQIEFTKLTLKRELMQGDRTGVPPSCLMEARLRQAHANLPPRDAVSQVFTASDTAARSARLSEHFS